MSKLAIVFVVACVILATFWVSLNRMWKWIPRRPARDTPGGGEVASGLAAILQETRQSIEAGALHGPALVHLVERLRRLHERHLASGGPGGAEDVIAAIAGNPALMGLVRELSRAHRNQLGKAAEAVLSDPRVAAETKEALRVIHAGLLTLVGETDRPAAAREVLP